MQTDEPGYRAFRDNYDILVCGIQSPAELADRLFSKRMITTEIREKVASHMHKRDRTRELLAAVERKLISEPASFNVFVAVINEEPAYEVIAQKLTDSYEEHNAQETSENERRVTHGGRVASHEAGSRAEGCRFWLINSIFCWCILLAALVTFFGLDALLKCWYNQSAMTTCTELEKPSLHHGSDEFVPNNLPHVRGPFVGRDSELLGISNMLLASSADVAMVSIFGAPAVGKSTLAIQVGHVLASKGISVRYVDLNEAHHLFASSRHVDASDKPIHIHSTDDSTDLTFHKADVTIPWYSHTKKMYVLTSPKKLIVWAKELTNDTVLILDNCDDVLQRNKTHENNFKEMLIELLKASKYLRILTTSRAQMLIVGGFRPYPLKELDSSSAITLLQLRSNLVTSDEGKVIAELVGNNPLALGIVAELINANSSPPHAIIDELRKHLMQTLSQNTLSNSQRILTVLKLSYNYLNDRIQLCSHYLSHFPGSFHRAAAQSILSMCNLSDPEYCLQALVERSLLEQYWHTGQFRYKFHRLIGEFLRYVQTEYSDAHAVVIKTKFNLNYNFYYSQDILSLSKIYSRNPDSYETISRLEHDMHNFLNILRKMVDQQLDIKSALNIAYSFTNSSDFVIELLNCDCLIELLQALNSIFDQKIVEITREIGLNETTVLYFNLMFDVKKLVTSTMFSAESCMAMCSGTFATHYSRVEKLSAVESKALDALYYHPLTCYLDCHYMLDFSFMQAATTTLLILIFFCIIYLCGVKNRCIVFMLCVITVIAFMRFYTQLFYNCTHSFFFSSKVYTYILHYSNRFVYLYYIAVVFIYEFYVTFLIYSFLFFLWSYKKSTSDIIISLTGFYHTFEKMATSLMPSKRKHSSSRQ